MTGLRSLATTVFVPSAVFGIGQGAGAPIIALVARDLGASVGVAGVMVGLVGLGSVFGDLPAGRLVARFGERIAIVVGSTVGAAGVLVSLLAPNPAVLGAGATMTGLATAVWGLARQSYLAEVVPFDQRARAMAMFALMWRLGFFAGPFVGASVIVGIGARGGFVVQLVCIVLSCMLMVRVPDPPRAAGATPRGVPLAVILRRHSGLLTSLGMGSLLMGAARAAREAVLPLWADHIGIDAAAASMVFGVGALFDMLCSYPAGHLMDRHGRRFIAVPSLLIIALSYFALPMTESLVGLVVVATIMGIGNGFGNGVIMTLGADVAPAATRPEFLAAWRLTHDCGIFLGPLAVGVAALTAPLAISVAALGVVSAVGGAVMFRCIPRYAPWPKRSTGFGPVSTSQRGPDRSTKSGPRRSQSP